MKRTSIWPSPSKTSAVCTTIALLLLVSACGSGPASGDWAGEVVDSADIRIVRNPMIGLWHRGEEPTVREVLRIGEAEGEAAYLFGDISGVNVDPEGRIYVGDSQAREIRVFSESGEYLHSIGRPGSGPGELGPGGTSVHFGRGDTLFIPDPGQQRVNLFLQNGVFVRSFQIPMADGISVRWAVTPDYDLLQHLRKIPVRGLKMEADDDLVIRRGPDGSALDTVMRFASGETVQYSGGSPKMLIFAPAPIWEIGDDGRIFFAVNSDYRIEIRDLDGSLKGLIERAHVPQPVTEADRNLLRNFITDLYVQQGMPGATLQVIMEGTSFADYYPAFSTIMPGYKGSIWVQQVVSATEVAEGGEFSIEDMGSPRWDVFDRDGRFLGVITLPARFEPKRFNGNLIYGVQKDEMDVEYVVVLEINGALGRS